jgi:hypothetical protein
MLRQLLLVGPFIFVLTACQLGAPPINVGSPSIPKGGGPAPMAQAPVVTARWDDKHDGRNWTELTWASLQDHGNDLIDTMPADILSYCPGYLKADRNRRAAFWVGLISALAKWESDYKPGTSFTEPNIVDQAGRRVVSRGLLQISMESANSYACAIVNEQDLHNPNVNLSCAVRIMNRLVARDGQIASTTAPWHGAAAYWSPFRRSKHKADLQAWTSQQAYCR